jgi:hypothetical protein
METDSITITKEEKQDFEKWLAKSVNAEQNAQIDPLTLILYKLSSLEEKISRIEYQTKTHWVN